ncbi:DUF4238 domain-containing protein [Lonepinella sp. MS14435]|uniref:DUF4238 domain-containing protein n=1 Tax=Lonepinella sp. MS14435 TaxID=3003618 RepID=UPI0036DBE3D0
MTKDKFLKQDIKRKHHYLPKVYSKQWKDNRGILNINLNGEIIKCKPENAFLEKDLNRLDFITATQISTIKELYKSFLYSEFGKSTLNFIDELHETSRILENLSREELNIYIVKNDLSYIFALSEIKLESHDLDYINKIKQILLSNLIEDVFSDVETNYGEFIEALSQQDNSILKKYIQYLLLFSTLQKFRSPNFLNQKRNELNEILQTKENDVKNCLILSVYIEHKRFLLELSKYYICIDLVSNVSGEYFLTSDSPFVSCDNEIRNKLEIDDCDYFFPISPIYLAVICKGQKRDKNTKNTRLSFGEINNKMVIQEINSLISRSCQNLIFYNVKEKQK